MNAGFGMLGPLGPIAKSMVSIGVLFYLRSPVANILSGIAPGYAGFLAEILFYYGLFVAYAQGWITAPTGLLA